MSDVGVDLPPILGGGLDALHATLSIVFTLPTPYYRAILGLATDPCLSVCLSQAGIAFKRLRESSWIFFWYTIFPRSAHHTLCLRNWGISKNRGNFFPNCGLLAVARRVLGLIRTFLCTVLPSPKRHIDRFSRFCTSQPCDQQTDRQRQTDRQTDRTLRHDVRRNSAPLTSKLTRSPAVARMADRSAPVVKLTLTLTLILPGP